ncbi:MAG: hypothetical protein SGARI_004808 [Bacillariaceae sp.]
MVQVATDATKVGGSDNSTRLLGKGRLYGLFPELCTEEQKSDALVESSATNHTDESSDSNHAMEVDSTSENGAESNQRPHTQREKKRKQKKEKKAKKKRKKEKKRRRKDEEANRDSDSEGELVSKKQHDMDEKEESSAAAAGRPKEEYSDSDDEEEDVPVADLLTIQYRMYRKNKSSSKDSKKSFMKNITRILASAQDGGIPLRSLDSMSHSQTATFVSERLADVELEDKVYMGILKLFSKGFKTEK